ncbi:hypothetical protein Rleg5DRAFT_0955 [Rhizobium leguminosarum bv. viciae WSM1455]|nr:hypothetical protein Rleg5DRAFT_0955 [Rhizobium leguminosarum bv. viciae WSM1455]
MPPAMKVHRRSTASHTIAGRRRGTMEQIPIFLNGDWGI